MKNPISPANPKEGALIARIGFGGIVYYIIIRNHEKIEFAIV